MHATDPEGQQWLDERSGLDEVVCESLMAEETRPRSAVMDDGILVILRGVNMNPGADPEDMVSLRLWVEPTRIVTVGRRRLLAVENLSDLLKAGTGPCDPGDLLTGIAEHMLDHMIPALENLEDDVDAQEERAMTEAPSGMQMELAELRRQIIGLRRHLAPQREAMIRLALATASLLDEEHQGQLQLLADQVTRYVEDLDALRDRTGVTFDFLSGREAEAMNRRMMIVSIVTAIFLPLGLITGLLGINVEGIPGAHGEWAFAIVCFLLLCLAAGQLFLLRKLKWF
jgi:zinc transporter